MTITLTVSIVNYNSTEFLLKCLESLQTHSQGINLELIIADNRSRDFDADTVREAFPRARIVENSRNLGFARAHNRNLRSAKGDYFLILNPDTLLRDNFLHAGLECLEKDSEIGVLGPQLISENGEPKPISALLPSVGSTICYYLLIDRLWKALKPGQPEPNGPPAEIESIEQVHGAAMLIRATVFQRLQGFDERFFLYFEESDFCKRASEVLTCRICRMNRFKVIHMHGRSSLQTDIRQTVFHQSCYEYFRKNQGWLPAQCIRLSIFVGELFRILYLHVHYLLRLRRGDLYIQKLRSSLAVLLWTMGLKNSLQASNAGND